MAWRNAPSVAAALSQATSLWHGRSRLSDGTIGDAAHAARKSDHNPDSRGIVHAFDITHDPAHGVDCEQLAAHLIAGKDQRVKYIIWNRRISESPGWRWRAYSGSNPHTKHMHVSIKATFIAENDLRAWWVLAAVAPLLKKLSAVGRTPFPESPYPGFPLRKGSGNSFAPYIRIVQGALMEWGFILVEHGVFGPKTEAAVKEFQKHKRLQPDGIVGPKTWAALWKA